MRTLLFYFLIFLSFSLNAQSLRELYNKSVEAYNNEDYMSFENINIEALKLNPSQPTLLFNLAKAYVLNGKYEKSHSLLLKLLSWNVNLKFEEDKDFHQVITNGDFSNALKYARVNYSKKNESSSIYIKTPKTYHLEDLSIIDDKIFLTDVRNGFIIEHNSKTAKLKEVIQLSGSVLSIIQGDEKNIIWATTCMMPEYYKYEEAKKNQGFLFKINTLAGTIVKSIKIGDDAVLGSMVLTKDRKIYATSSSSPKVYVVDTLTNKVEATISINEAFNLQGITVDKKNEFIYIADYIKGIVKINLNDFNERKWFNSNKYLLKGIDGLTFIQEGVLIAIQNNSNPKKVVKVIYSDTEGVTNTVLLDNALDVNGEPTNGKYYDGLGYFYISNSQWPFYNKERHPINDKWEEQTIRVLKNDFIRSID